MRIDPALSPRALLPGCHSAAHLLRLHSCRHPHLRLREICHPCDSTAPIEFSRYLEKRNREDRADLTISTPPGLPAPLPAPAGAPVDRTTPRRGTVIAALAGSARDQESSPSAPRAPRLGDVSTVVPSAAGAPTAYPARPAPHNPGARLDLLA